MKKKPKGRKTAVLVGFLAVAVIAVTTVVMVYSASRSSGDGGEERSSLPEAGTARTSFNRFYHYLVDRSNSEDDISYTDMANGLAYLDAEQDPGDMEDYLDNLDAKYTAFVSVYGKTKGSLIPENIYPYFYGYRKVDYEISRLDIIGKYREAGVDGARDYIYGSISPLGDASKTSTALDEYVISQREKHAAYASLMPYFENAGCIADGSLAENCSFVVDDNSEGLKDLIADATVREIDLIETMRSSAYSDLMRLYGEIYDKNTNSGDSK